MKTKISAEIIAHTRNEFGDELITYELVFPRFILAELNTHRAFSKNSASSRAIPFKKMVDMVIENPFIPIAWQKEHKGMQGMEYFTDSEMPNNMEPNWFTNRWLEARDKAVEQALIFNKAGVTKQLVNRLLEPFMWHKVVLTTGLEGLKNFFELRCPQYSFGENTNNPRVWKSRKDTIKDFPDWATRNQLFWFTINKGQAEIHMMELAEQMYDAYNESTGIVSEYHIPYQDKIRNDYGVLIQHEAIVRNHVLPLPAIMSAMMCARVSYTTIGDSMSEWSVEKYVKKFNELINSVPAHSSPLEHVARAMNEEEYYLYSRGKDGSASHEHGWCRNFKGFVQLRHILE